MKKINQEIPAEFKKLLAKLGKEKNPSQIKPESRIGEDLGLDSFGSVELIYNLEDIFHIEIPERNFDSSLTVRELVEFISLRSEGKTPAKTLGSKNDFIASLKVDKSILEEANFNPYYQQISSGLGRKITIANRKLILLSSNDYLGVANNPAIKKEAIKIIEKYGLSMCATPIVTGQTKINRDLEIKIAAFLKQEDALLYPSCYQCNLGVFHLLAKESDTILADRNIHSSLINGCLLSQANLRFFPHNDMPSLEKMLKNSSGSRMRFIVVEGLYSTDGDIACLDKIVKLAKEYRAFTIVDDAHGVGVLGSEGRGILEKFNCYNEIDLITGSLGKALGLFGGFMAGKEKIIDYFRYNSPMYFYSTALPAHIAAAGMASIDFVKSRNDLRRKIFGYKEKLFNRLKEIGYNLTPSQTPLFSILFNDVNQTLKMAKLLFKELIYVVPFLPPSVPKDSPRIRLLTSAYLKEEDISQVIKVFQELRKEYATK